MDRCAEGIDAEGKGVECSGVEGIGEEGIGVEGIGVKGIGVEGIGVVGIGVEGIGLNMLEGWGMGDGTDKLQRPEAALWGSGGWPLWDSPNADILREPPSKGLGCGALPLLVLLSEALNSSSDGGAQMQATREGTRPR